MRNKRFFRIALFIAISLGLCLLFFGILFFFPNVFSTFGKLTIEQTFDRYQKEQQSKLTSAQDTWSQQGIGDYRLRIEVTSRLVSYGGVDTKSPSCLIESEVQNGSDARLVGSTCSTCGYLLPDVDSAMLGFAGERFNIFENLDVLTVDEMFDKIRELFKEPWCGPNGCECDGFDAYDVDYNHVLGYPTSLKLIHKSGIQPAFCTLVGTEFLAPEYKITLVQPPYEEQPIGIESALIVQEVQGYMNQNIDLHDFSILVTKFEEGTKSELAGSSPAGYKYVTVYMTIISKRSEAYDINSFNAILYDSDGGVYGEYYAYQEAPKDSKAQMQIVYKVPQNTHGFVLKYGVSCSTWNEQAVIVLTK